MVPLFFSLLVIIIRSVSCNFKRIHNCYHFIFHLLLGRRLLVGFGHVAFQFSEADFGTTFLKVCGIGEVLGTATCLIIVTADKQVYTLCKIL